MKSTSTDMLLSGHCPCHAFGLDRKKALFFFSERKVLYSQHQWTNTRQSFFSGPSRQNWNVPIKSHLQNSNRNAVSKSHLTRDSMQLYADKWTSRSDLVTDGFFLPLVALISFHGAEWNVSQTLEHHLSQFSMSTAAWHKFSFVWWPRANAFN